MTLVRAEMPSDAWLPGVCPRARPQAPAQFSIHRFAARGGSRAERGSRWEQLPESGSMVHEGEAAAVVLYVCQYTCNNLAGPDGHFERASTRERRRQNSRDTTQMPGGGGSRLFESRI